MTNDIPQDDVAPVESMDVEATPVEEPVAPPNETPPTTEDETPEEPESERIILINVPEQNLGMIDEESSPANDKNPSELYRSSLMVGVTYPMSVTYGYGGTWPNAKMRGREEVFESEEDKDYIDELRGAMSYYAPAGIGVSALSREGSEWGNAITGEGITPIKPRSFRRAGTTATALLSRITNTGTPVSLHLPYTGIHVTFVAPTESDYCDYDIMQAMETSLVGMGSFGLQLSASSGIYMRHMIEFCLRYATSTTYDTEGGDIAQALINVVDERDYISILMGPTLAKFPGGIPWEIVCPDGACRDVSHITMNIARALRYDNNALTIEQKQMLANSKMPNSVTDEDIEKYRSYFRNPKSAVYTVNYDDNIVNIHLQYTTLGDYLNKSSEWAREINEATTEALGNYATEHQRNSHMRTRAESRRLTRYSHRIEKIEVVVDPDGEDLRAIEENEVEILKILTQLSASPKIVTEFEEHINKFTDDTTYMVMGFMAKPCPACGNKPMTKTGEFRGIIPISPDRVFLGLSQAISSTQIALRDMYEMRG